MNSLARPLRAVLQVSAYAAFCGFIWYFSAAPAYTRLDPTLALLRVSFSHAGERREPCRRYTPEEIAQMAPNMRRAMDCERARVPLRVQIEVDGKIRFDAEVPPTGLQRDGSSSVNVTVPVRPGHRRVVARMRDSRRVQGFDYENAFELTLGAGDHRVLDFRPKDGGFRLL